MSLDAFTLGGSPSSIRSSAGLWSSFATSASTASGDITGVQTGEFIGDEGDTYRGRINDDLVPHLDVASEAWNIVGTALKTYADGLEGLQTRMSGLRTQYIEQQGKVSEAHTSWINAKAADQQHSENRQSAADRLEAGQTLPTDTYQTQAGGAHTNYLEAQNVLNGLVTQAGTVRSEHGTLMQTCCREIDKAKDKRPVKPPGRWDKLKKWAGDKIDGAKTWIKENADILKKISGVLKIVSAITGVLALIPVLAPVMGPIALATGAAALAIDVAVMWATGEWDMKALALDALGLIPGGKALATIGKAGKIGKATTAVDKSANSIGKASKAVKTAKKAKGTKNSRKALKSAKKDLAAARNTHKTNLANQKAVQAHYDKIDKIWDRIGLGTSVTSTGVTTGTTYAETGSIKEALIAGGISALGIKIPNSSPAFKVYQGLVSNAAGTGKQINTMATDPSKRELKDWAKLIKSAGGFGAHTYNGYHG